MAIGRSGQGGRCSRESRPRRESQSRSALRSRRERPQGVRIGNEVQQSSPVWQFARTLESWHAYPRVSLSARVSACAAAYLGDAGCAGRADDQGAGDRGDQHGDGERDLKVSAQEADVDRVRVLNEEDDKEHQRQCGGDHRDVQAADPGGSPVGTTPTGR